MRKASIASVTYSAGNVPSNQADFSRFIQEELAKIQAAIRALALGHLEVTYVPPEKPRQGDIRYADGAEWNPDGEGREGIYRFNGEGWVYVG